MLKSALHVFDHTKELQDIDKELQCIKEEVQRLTGQVNLEFSSCKLM